MRSKSEKRSRQVRILNELIETFDRLKKYEGGVFDFSADTYEKSLMRDLETYIDCTMRLLEWGNKVIPKLKSMLKLLEPPDMERVNIMTTVDGRKEERFEARQVRVIRTAKDRKKGEVAQSLSMFLELSEEDLDFDAMLTPELSEEGSYDDEDDPEPDAQEISLISGRRRKLRRMIL
jgi:hypothetical protein